MKKIFYAEQELDGKWRPFLQEIEYSGENVGSIRWMDPGKITFDTEQEALNGAKILSTWGNPANVTLSDFVDALDTDFRQGRVDIAVKNGTDEQVAYQTELDRVNAANGN